MPLSLEEQLETTNAVIQFARLYALDQVRTDYLQRAEFPIPDQDVQVLNNLAEEMDELLQAAPDRAGYLERLIVEHAEELYQSYERILFSEEELTGDQKMRLDDIAARRHGDILEYGRGSARTVRDIAPVERETLAAEMETIRRGGFAAGDLSKQVGCNLAGGCIIGGLFAPPPMNLVGVGIGITILLGYEIGGDPC